jgi:hypothetical protein
MHKMHDTVILASTRWWNKLDGRLTLHWRPCRRNGGLDPVDIFKYRSDSSGQVTFDPRAGSRMNPKMRFANSQRYSMYVYSPLGRGFNDRVVSAHILPMAPGHRDIRKFAGRYQCRIESRTIAPLVMGVQS